MLILMYDGGEGVGVGKRKAYENWAANVSDRDIVRVVKVSNAREGVNVVWAEGRL